MNYEHIRFGEQIYQSPFTETSNVFDAKIGDEAVVVKRRSTAMGREVEVLRSLDHSHFPHVKTYFEHESSFYLAIDKMPGTALSKLIDLKENWSSDVLDIPESIGIVRRLALGLVALRNAGYYYRDFNLGHILLDDAQISLVDHEADVKIADDKSAIVDLETGTWETMAPEEFTVGSKMYESTTTYTLAVILYQLTHGQNPFHLEHIENKTMDEMRELSRRLHLEVPQPEKFTHLKRFFARALQPNPEDRFQDLEDFIMNIEQL